MEEQVSKSAVAHGLRHETPQAVGIAKAAHAFMRRSTLGLRQTRLLDALYSIPEHGYNSYIRRQPVRTVNIARLKNQLSKYLTFVKTGEEVVIRERNLPIAKLVPFRSEDASEQDLRLVAAGKLRLPKSKLDLKRLLAIPTGNVPSNKAVQAVLADRDEE
jgi:prevent-host-death family protein